MTTPRAAAPKSWDDVDKLLREIGELQNQGDVLAAEFNGKLNELKENYEAKKTDVEEKIKAKAKLLKNYIKKHKDEIAADAKQNRTRSLLFGKVGLRASSKIIISDETKTVQLLKNLRLFNCIVTKEVPNREALENYDDTTLIAVGARREPQESTWYEVDREKFRAPATR